MALSAAAVALLAGCGGDDSTSTETSSTAEIPTGELSKEMLASEADALCTAANQRIVDAASPPTFGEDGPQPDEVEASAQFWSASVTEGEALVDQLSQLQPEKQAQEQWDEFLVLFESGTVEYSADLQAAAEAADPDGLYEAALDRQKELEDLAEASAGLGMKVCGASDVPSS